MNKENIPPFLISVIKQGAYKVYELSERILVPPIDKYDFETFKVIDRCLKKDSNCIDVGAHKGYILSRILKAAPFGKHLAFEPIPYLAERLCKQYKNKVTIHNKAVSDKVGKADFTLFRSRPAISGFKERDFKSDNYDKENIIVPVTTLDIEVGLKNRIDMIKIDVEGAEMQVLLGGTQLIQRYKPIVLFEFTLASKKWFGTTPEEIYDYFSSADMCISTMSLFLKNCQPFDKHEFCGQFYKGYNYFFIAYDLQKKY